MSKFPQDLAERYQRFRENKFTPNIADFKKLASEGQSPEVMVVSCCDSRVPPEAVFSSGPGDMFVVRNVANLVPPFETGGRYHGVSAALEFAVLNLRVKHIVVMGHSGCGGIKASLDQNAAEQTELRFISNWMSMLDEVKLSVLSANQAADPQVMQDELELYGILASLKNLRTFPFIQELEKKGELALHGAHFEVGSGSLRVLDEEKGKFEKL